MPDFDANDDRLRLSGAASDDPYEVPKVFPRFAPRARALACARCSAPLAPVMRRLASERLVRRRNSARRVCGDRAMVLAGPPRRRRRLWTRCHGRPPGSPS